MWRGRYDPHAEFVKMWIPSLKGLSAEIAHAPWTLPVTGTETHTETHAETHAETHTETHRETHRDRDVHTSTRSLSGDEEARPSALRNTGALYIPPLVSVGTQTKYVPSAEH